MDPSKTARVFLGLNAAFSLLTGTAFLLGAGYAADMLFAEPGGWQPVTLRALGVGLILFGGDLALKATNRLVAKHEVMLVTMMDIGWVLGSVLLLVFGSDLFSGMGKAAVIVVAGCVALFALGQFMGARKIHPPLSCASVKTSGRKILATVRRPVNAPADVVWRVMTDHPGYADVAANIAKVEVVSGEGLGMLRQCRDPKGATWQETCDLYDEGRAYGVRIHTEASDYPYPIAELRGEWSVEGHGVRSEFTIRVDAVPKGNALARALFAMMAKRQFKMILADLADAWAIRMEREACDNDAVRK